MKIEITTDELSEAIDEKINAHIDELGLPIEIGAALRAKLLANTKETVEETDLDKLKDEMINNTANGVVTSMFAAFAAVANLFTN